METEIVTKFQFQFLVCICKFYDCAKFRDHQMPGKKLPPIKIYKFFSFSPPYTDIRYIKTSMTTCLNNAQYS